MPKPTEQILSEIKELKSWLYGANGYEGDIPEIKKLLNGYDKRISRNSRLLFTMMGILMASGAGFGIAQWLG